MRKPNGVVPINADPRHQPGAPLNKYEKRTIVALLVGPIVAVVLVGLPLALAGVGAVAGLVHHPDAWQDAFIGVATLVVILVVLSPLIAIGGRR